MSESVVIDGVTFPDINGFKVTDTNNNVLTYVHPSGTLSITQNGTAIDVSQYASVDVAVAGSGGVSITQNANGYLVVGSASGGGTGYTLLASGSYTLASDASSTMTVPVSYTGTANLVAVIRDEALTDVGHALGSICLFNLPAQAISDVFNESLFSVRIKASNNTVGYSSNSSSYKLSISDSAITLPKPGNAYPWKAGDYSWYIYGVTT